MMMMEIRHLPRTACCCCCMALQLGDTPTASNDHLHGHRLSAAEATAHMCVRMRGWLYTCRVQVVIGWCVWPGPVRCGLHKLVKYVPRAGRHRLLPRRCTRRRS